MIQVRKANERGYVDFDWLKAKHSFSFGSYFDPAHMGFRSLRVINNDLIAGGGGFDTHPHKDMEIITFLLQGQLEHRDNMGNHSVIKPGEIQIMSAGTGVYHSEYNPSETEKTKLYQIWIKPNELSVKPRYEQYSYTNRVIRNDFIDLVTPQGGDQVAKIYQKAVLKYGEFDQDKSKKLKLEKDKGYWIQVIEGKLNCQGFELAIEDGMQIEQMQEVILEFNQESKILLFELA